MRPDKELLDLEQQFVRLLIINMADVDVGRFEFDFDTTFAVLTLNKNGQIISRYGGRDAKSPESFINKQSLHKALTRSLSLHKKSEENLVTLPQVLKTRAAKSYPFVANVAARCVHCHDVASAQAIEAFKTPDFDILKDIWIHPEPITLGLDLDPNDGTTLQNTFGLAKEAGISAGDRIVSFNKVPVSTFTDIQYQMHRIPNDAKSLEVQLQNKELITLKLEGNWKHSDITWRRIGLRLSPSAGFGGTPLNKQQKTKLNLPEDGFATSVSFINFSKPANSPLEKDDIIISVNGVQKSELTQHAALYINLTHQLDEELALVVIRKGEHMNITLKVTTAPSDNQRVMDSDSRMMGKGGRGGGMRGGGMRGEGMRGKGMRGGQMRPNGQEGSQRTLPSE